MDDISACLSANIRRLRKEKSLTQAELAERAGISVIFLQSIEAQRKWISPLTAKAIAKSLKVPQARLFENCFEKTSANKKRQSTRTDLEHIPEDILRALNTTCRRPNWQWQMFRWIIQGFERQRP